MKLQTVYPQAILVFDSRDLCKWNHVRAFLEGVERKKETLADLPEEFDTNFTFLFDCVNKHLINLVGVNKYSMYLKEKVVDPPTKHHLAMLEYLQANKENIYTVTEARGLHGVIINLKNIVLKSVDAFLDCAIKTYKRENENGTTNT